MLASVMGEAVDLIEDSVYLDLVIAGDVQRAFGPVVGMGGIRNGVAAGNVKRSNRQGNDRRVDLRSKEVIRTMIARPVDPFIGRVLVDPGGVEAGFARDIEDCINAYVLLRKDGLAAIVGIARQKRRVDASAGIKP